MPQQTEPDFRGFFRIIATGYLRKLAVENGKTLVRVLEGGKVVGYYDTRTDPYFEETKERYEKGKERA